MELEDEFGTEIPDEEAEKSTLLVMLLSISIVLKIINLYLSRQSAQIFFFVLVRFHVKLELHIIN